MKSRHCFHLTPLLVALGLCGLLTEIGFAEDESSPSDAKPATVSIPGVFESTRESEVSADNEQLASLKIERVVPSGSSVKKGQSLVWFETKPMNEKVREAQIDLQLAKLTLESEQFAHEQFLERLKLDRAKATRTRHAAQQEYDNYQKVDRERQIKQAEFSLKSAEFSLESATEEYRQLEQMYKEDDLTEQSEEIVLRRAKRSMESAAFSLERTKISTARTIKQTVPRNDHDQEDKLTRAQMDYEKAIRDMATDEQKRKLEMQRKQTKYNEQAEKFKKLQEERKAVVLKAEQDGIFLHGQLTRGKLGAKEVVLKKGDTVTGKQVMGVVVDPSRLQVRIDLPEDKLAKVRKGASCKIVPKSQRSASIAGTVKLVGEVPYINAKHDCIVAVRGKTPGIVRE